MDNYLDLANGLSLYIVVGVILAFITFTCVLFMVKSYRAGIRIGMDRKVLKKAITSSASFTVLPSVSILLGVIALSGNLGIPISWLRLSVIGNLQYEATVASIAAESMGTKLDSALLSMDHLVTIMLVMTVGIIWGCILSITMLKSYAGKLKRKTAGKQDNEVAAGRKGFASIAMIAMFIGLCATFLGSYVGDLVRNKAVLPIVTAAISALAMYFVLLAYRKKGWSVLESFSLAISMICGMVGAVIVNLFI